MASSEGQTPPSSQAEFNLWGMLDGLIDRLIHEGAALPYPKETYKLPNQNDGLTKDTLPSTHQLHQYSNNSYEVSNHHRKVTEKVRRARSLFEPVSPYVLKHKYISELLDIMPKDQEKMEKKKMRRLKKLRVKPFREITDWGLTDSDTDGDSDEAADRPETKEKPMTVGDNDSHDTVDIVVSQSQPGVFGDTINLEMITNTPDHKDNRDPETDVKLQTNEAAPVRMSVSETTDARCIQTPVYEQANSYDVSNYDFTPKIEDLHLYNRDIIGDLDLPPQVYAEDLSFGRQGQPEAASGGESLTHQENDFINVSNTYNRNIVSGKDMIEYGGNSDVIKQEFNFPNLDKTPELNSHPQHTQLSSQEMEFVFANDGGLVDLNIAQNRHMEEKQFIENQAEAFGHCGNESRTKLKEKTSDKAAEQGQEQEECHPRQPMNRDLIVEIGDVEQDEMDYILETLLRAQRNFKNVIPSITQEEFQQKMEKYMERKKAELGGNDVTVTAADAKRVTLLEHVIKYFEKKIVEIVKFAKCIPGFQTLGVDDQANLIKVSRTESGLVGGVGVSLQEGVVKAENESAIPLDMIGSVVGPQYMKDVFRVTSKIDSVNITEKEGALLRGITITYTDRCKLNEPEKVQSIQNKLVTCLLRVVEEESTDVSAQVRMGQLVEVLTTLRNYTDADSNLLQNALNNYPNYSSNDLVKEFLEPHP